MGVEYGLVVFVRYHFQRRATTIGWLERAKKIQSLTQKYRTPS